MKLISYMPLAIALLSIAVAAADQEADPPPPTQFAVDLFDGSRLIGVLASDALPLHTSFADLSIPVTLIRHVQFKDGGAAGVVELRNGDKLSGKITLESLALTTVFGQVNLDLQYVRRLTPTAAPYLTQTDAARVLTFRHKRYLFVNKRLTWQAAADWCKARGATLVCIVDAAENDFVCRLVRRDTPKLESFWGGATDLGHEGQWTWIDGTPFGYTNWTRRQPDNSGGRETSCRFI